MIDNCKNILIELLNVKYKNFEKYFIKIIRTYMYVGRTLPTRPSYIISNYMVFG